MCCAKRLQCDLTATSREPRKSADKKLKRWHRICCKQCNERRGGAGRGKEKKEGKEQKEKERYMIQNNKSFERVVWYRLWSNLTA